MQQKLSSVKNARNEVFEGREIFVWTKMLNNFYWCKMSWRRINLEFRPSNRQHFFQKKSI